MQRRPTTTQTLTSRERSEIVCCAGCGRELARGEMVHGNACVGCNDLAFAAYLDTEPGRSGSKRNPTGRAGQKRRDQG